MPYTVTTNNVPRDLIDAYELTADERAEFDYLDWDAIDDGRDSATFFRYRGELYALDQFMREWGMLKTSGLPAHLCSWDGVRADSYSSAMLIRLVGDDRVVVACVFSHS